MQYNDGTWTSIGSGSCQATLHSTDPIGTYRFRARNTSQDTWKESATTGTLQVIGLQLTLTANATTICSSGDGQSTITVTTNPVTIGKTINFAIVGNNLESNVNNGSLNKSSAVTNLEGKATVILTSYKYCSNPEENIDFIVTVKASSSCAEDATIDIKYMPPAKSLDIFLDPVTEEHLSFIYADGESEAANYIYVSYGGEGLSGHDISWKFKFYTTLEQEEPDYEGTGEDPYPYGHITTSSTTNSSGTATSIYTAGTVGGYIEIFAEDEDVYLPQYHSPLSWFKSWIEELFGGETQEPLKLRVYVRGGVLMPDDFDLDWVKSFIRDSFNFVPDSRFEFVDTEFVSCGSNEFKIVVGPLSGNIKRQEAGEYKGNCNCIIYYQNIYNFYMNEYSETSNPSLYEVINEIAGRTAAHEMGHSIAKCGNLITHHHDNCIMYYQIIYPVQHQHFCRKDDNPTCSCQHNWNNTLGGGLINE